MGDFCASYNLSTANRMVIMTKKELELDISALLEVMSLSGSEPLIYFLDIETGQVVSTMDPASAYYDDDDDFDDPVEQAIEQDPDRYVRIPEYEARDEYRLTSKGKDLFDILMALWRWGDEWDPPAPGTMRELIHLDCGNATHSVPHCAHCGEELTRRNLRIVPGLDVVEARLAATTAEG